jgi:hypothetical protein
VPSPSPLPGKITVPEQVLVSMAEIAGAAKEALLTLAVGTGLQVMAAMSGEDVTRMCGPQGKHNRDRAGVPAWRRGRVGHPGRAALAGDPAQGAGGRWVRRAAPAVV